MKRETSQIISDFQQAKTERERKEYQFEIYFAHGDKLMGYAVDEMSNRRLSAGYEALWTLTRGDIRVTIVSNDPDMTINHAIHFAKCFFDNRYVTFNIDLEKR